MKGAVILIAEGDGRLCQNLKERLFQHGYKISEACDKNDALRILKFSKPALIVLGSSPNGDWDGLELAEQVRRDDRTIPLILINSYSCEERAIAGFILRQVKPGHIYLEEHARAQPNAVQFQRLAVHLRAIFEPHAFQLGRLCAAREQRSREHPRNHTRCSRRARWRARAARSGTACSRPPDSS